MESPKNKRLYDLVESAEYIGIPTTTLTHQFFTKNQKTKPEPSYVGGRLFFKKKNLDRYIDELPTQPMEG